MYLCCQLVDGPKLQYQILIDDHRVHKQPNGITPNLHALIDGHIQPKNISSIPTAEDPHEAYLRRETLTERTYLDFFTIILPIDL